MGAAPPFESASELRRLMSAAVGTQQKQTGVGRKAGKGCVSSFTLPNAVYRQARVGRCVTVTVSVGTQRKQGVPRRDGDGCCSTV
jgi:hypothetical protein